MNVSPITNARRLSWLSPRERAVLARLMLGDTVEQIAQADFVAVCTVRTQVRGIMRKLGVRTQVAAIAIGYSQLWPTADEHRSAVMAAS